MLWHWAPPELCLEPSCPPHHSTPCPSTIAVGRALLPPRSDVLMQRGGQAIPSHGAKCLHRLPPGSIPAWLWRFCLIFSIGNVRIRACECLGTRVAGGWHRVRFRIPSAGHRGPGPRVDAVTKPLPRETRPQGPKGWAGGPSRVAALSPAQPIPAGPACSRRCSPQGSEETLELSSPQPVLAGSQSSPLPFIGAASRPSPRSCPRLAEWPYLQESPWHGL